MSSYDYDRAFAQDGQRADITDTNYKGGWYNVVGGLNGIPTVQQFNAIMNEQENKINETHQLAVESAAKSATQFDYDSSTKTLIITTTSEE